MGLRAVTNKLKITSSHFILWKLDLNGNTQGGLSHKKDDGGARRTFQGLKKRFWYLLGCPVLKAPQRKLRYLLGYCAEKNKTRDI